MDLLAILRRSGGIDALARKTDLPPANVASGVEALLPALLAGLRAYAQRMGGGETGIALMLAMIDGLGDGNLAVAIMGPAPLDPQAGDRVVAQFFGSVDAAHQIANDVAAVTGEDLQELERIFPPLAMLVCGYISARAEVQDAREETIAWLCDLLMLQDGDEPLAGSGTDG